jgi:hypothetical protein
VKGDEYTEFESNRVQLNSLAIILAAPGGSGACFATRRIAPSHLNL